MELTHFREHPLVRFGGVRHGEKIDLVHGAVQAADRGIGAQRQGGDLTGVKREDLTRLRRASGSVGSPMNMIRPDSDVHPLAK